MGSFLIFLHSCFTALRGHLQKLGCLFAAVMFELSDLVRLFLLHTETGVDS